MNGEPVVVLLEPPSLLNDPASGARNANSLATVVSCMTRTEPADVSRAKATLFCQACGHESPMQGDWAVETTAGAVTTSCPCCGAIIDRRPTHHARDDVSARKRAGPWQVMTGAMTAVSASLTVPSRVLNVGHLGK